MKRKSCYFLVLFLVLVSAFEIQETQAEPVDSLVWSILKKQTSPIDISVKFAYEWQTPRDQKSTFSEYKTVYIDQDEWTFPIMTATKITAFKEELKIYDEWYKGNTAEDLQRAQGIFAGYGVTFGGNYDEHYYCPWDSTFAIVQQSVIKKLTNKELRNKIWEYAKPAFKHQLTTMSLRHQGVVVHTFEYVRDYFGQKYDAKKAEEWYKEDAETGSFSSTDYLGERHPARKITAFIERCMYKHKIIDIKEVRIHIQKIGAWLDSVLGKKYQDAKKAWIL